jgi:hypothetical protein
MVVATAAKATAKGIDINLIINKTCAFCDKQATDIISMDDLKFLSIKKDIPKHARKLVSLPICDMHFWKYVEHPHIKKS